MTETLNTENEGAGGPSVLNAGVVAWQPIETAPKDGTIILGFKFGILPIAVIWLPRSEDQSKNSDWWYSIEFPYLDVSGLTHWIPIPKAPTGYFRILHNVELSGREEKQ